MLQEVKNAVLIPNESVWELYKDDPRFQNVDVYYVTRGSNPLQGARFKDIWVHWFCHENPEYFACVNAIMHAMQFAAEPGQAYLFG